MESRAHGAATGSGASQPARTRIPHQAVPPAIERPTHPADQATHPPDQATHPAAPVAAEPEPALRSRAALLLAPMVSVLTFCVTGYRVGHRQLWEDEYSTWIASTMTLSQLRHLVSHLDFVVLPYYLFMHYWIQMFGDSATALRMPSVIAMSIAAGLLVLVGRRLFDTTTGVIAGVLFAAVPGISRYAQEARPYAMVVYLVILAALLLLRALEKPTWWRWLGYAAGMIAVAGAHVIAVVVLVAHAVGVWRLTRPVPSLVRRYGRFMLAVVLIGLVVAPFARRAHQQSAAVDWITLTWQTLTSFPADLFGSPVVAWIIIGLSVLGGFLASRSLLALLAGWALLPTVLLLATYPLVHLFFYRYLLFTIPAWVLLTGRGLYGIASLVTPRLARRVAIAVAVVAIGCLSLPRQSVVRQHLLPGSADFSGAAAQIAEQMRPGDGMAFAGSLPRARRGLMYEMRDWKTRPRDVFLAVSYVQAGDFWGRECAVPASCLGTTTRVWLVSTVSGNDPYAHMPAAAADLLKSGFTVVEDRELAHIHLLLLTRVPVNQSGA